jgi:hypothetical protein
MRSIWILGHTGSLQATLSAGVFGKWERFEPKQADCRAFCSYGSVPCPPIQAGIAAQAPAISFPGCGAYRPNGGKFEIVQTIQPRHSTPGDPEQRFQLARFDGFRTSPVAVPVMQIGIVRMFMENGLMPMPM